MPSLSAFFCLGLIALVFGGPGCQPANEPVFLGVDVSCAPAATAGDGLWTLSAWVEDADGVDDVTRVEVTILDFMGQVWDTRSLTRDQSNYWSDTPTEAELGIPCTDRNLYCFTFVATDADGLETRQECGL